MAITEESRHDLYQRLEEVLGHEAATVMMEHLPPVGWADVATRRDIDALRVDLDALRVTNRSDLDALRVATRSDFDGLRRDVELVEERLMLRFDARLERELRMQSNRFIVWTAGVVSAVLTLQTIVLDQLLS